MLKALVDSFWRAVAYCLHPKVIALSVMPLLVAGGITFTLGYFFWEPAVSSVREVLDSWSLLDAMFKWLAAIGASGLRSVLAPMVIVALAVPVVVVASLVLVAAFMTPAIVRLVVRRRFEGLEARGDASVLRSFITSVGFSLLALMALVVTLPLWFIPPLALVLPPAIWGWLAYRVLTFDTLVEHASAVERNQIRVTHRWSLFAMGVVTGMLGAVPTVIWAASALTFVFAPFLTLVSIWLYTLVFAFASLWFAHFGLAALQMLRRVPGAADTSSVPTATFASGPDQPTVVDVQPIPLRPSA